MIEEACAKRAKELKELLVRLDELNQDIGDDRLSKGSKTWLKEIDELEATIKLGLEIGWDYGENSAKFR
jgi:hypothetical protein